MKLPELTQAPLRHRGRNVRAGYQRGWGLQFSDLAQQVRSDKLYREALAAGGDRSVVSEHNRMNLFLLLNYFIPHQAGYGDVLEFGAYRGGNALFMAKVMSQSMPKARIYALDTYKGMPETDLTVDRHKAGDFADVDLTEIRRHAQGLGLGNLEFVQGLFEDTTPALLDRVERISLVHVDCDIYSAVKYSYDICKPKMVDGGYYVFDDALYSSCIGATEAVEEVVIGRDGLRSEQIFPHFVFRA